MVQSAGEQKYYNLIEERMKKIRTEMIMWTSILCLALISGLGGSLVLAFLLVAIGLVLAIHNLKEKKAVEDILLPVSDKADFYRQLIAEDTIDLAKLQMIITNKYMVTGKNQVTVYKLSDMMQIEVDVFEEGKKRYKGLYFTDKKGSRHRVTVCRVSSELEPVLEQAYHILIERIG